MNPRQKGRFFWPAILVVVWVAAARLDAQQPISLLTFTNAWRYEQSGTDQGTNWRARTFNDGAWPAGLPLFGVETAVPFPYESAGFTNFATPLLLTPPGGSVQTITYYFRTHFQFVGTNVAGVRLWATNYLDDGCVIYLNGSEAGRIRISAGQTWQTFANTGPAVEGQADTIELSSAGLRTGENVLAVEVHQLTLPNADIAFALSMSALAPESLSVTQSPVSQSVLVDRPASFRAGVSGGPAYYQWFKGAAAIPGATGATYEISAAQFSQAGAYHVRASNAVSVVESADALLTVLPDHSGPLLVSAVAVEGTPTNKILVQFSERIYVPSATIAWNYALRHSATLESVPIQSATANNAQVLLQLGTNAWQLGGDYFLTARDVSDSYGNVIAPDSPIGIGWPRHLQVLPTNAVWDFHAAAVFDPDVYNQDWMAPAFVPGPWWSRGSGPLCGGQFGGSLCLGPPATEIGYQPEPSLFRASFHWPGTDAPEPAPTLQITVNADDGVVLYLDGIELLRSNLLAAPVSASLRAITSVGAPNCLTLTLTNVAPGTHWLAAAVAQYTLSGTDGDSVFGCSVRADYYTNSSVPIGSPPVLSVTNNGAGQALVSWTGNGFALESATNFPPAWVEVTNVSNPFPVLPSEDRRFFRLRKGSP